MTYNTRNARHPRNDGKLSMAYNKRNSRGREWLAALAIIAAGIVVVTTAAFVGGMAAVTIQSQMAQTAAKIATITAVLGN